MCDVGQANVDYADVRTLAFAPTKGLSVKQKLHIARRRCLLACVVLY